MPSIEKINREIQALGADGKFKRIPEEVLQRWLPSDDLDDNAATLRALGFDVQMHDVEHDAHPLMELERRQGTKRLLTARKPLKSTVFEKIIEGRVLRIGTSFQVGVTIISKQDGHRKLSGNFAVDAP